MHFAENSPYQSSDEEDHTNTKYNTQECNLQILRQQQNNNDDDNVLNSHNYWCLLPFFYRQLEVLS